MASNDEICEVLLVQADDGDEHRTVSLIAAEDLAVLERSEGPVTEAAYGSWSHGHKMLCSRVAYARAMGVEKRLVEEALARFFSPEYGDVQLSDLMDVFDQVGEHYTYVAWTAGGDVVMRR